MKIIWKIMSIIFTILAVILGIILATLLIIKLIGHSPDDLTIISWSVGLLLTLQIVIITILFQIKGDVGELKEFKRESIEFKKQTINKINEIENKFK